jgi:hypothetical protein
MDVRPKRYVHLARLLSCVVRRASCVVRRASCVVHAAWHVSLVARIATVIRLRD